MNQIFFLLLVILIAFVSGFFLLLFQKKEKNCRENEQLAELAKWYKLALTDDLTNIQNRAAYSMHAAAIERRIQKTGESFCLILFDIDNFKKINDTYGHLAGDSTLQSVAGLLADVFLSDRFSLYRIGGDEFTIIGEKVTENEIVALLSELEKREEAEEEFHLSKGYAMINREKSFQEAFAEADTMLYADKDKKDGNTLFNH